MSGSAFLDTNILVYTFDVRDPAKQKTATRLVEEALEEQTGMISFQVVQEFLNVATRKFEKPLSPSDCSLYLEGVLTPLCEVHSSPGLYAEALEIQERWQLSFYDSLIVAAALAAGCETLYSEDLRDGLKVRDLTVSNPFA